LNGERKFYGGQSVLLWKLTEYVIAETIAGRVITKWPGEKRLRGMPPEIFPFPEEVDED